LPDGYRLHQLSEIKFEKLWSVAQPPDGTGFCDTAFAMLRPMLPTAQLAYACLMR